METKAEFVARMERWFTLAAMNRTYMPEQYQHAAETKACMQRAFSAEDFEDWQDVAERFLGMRGPEIDSLVKVMAQTDKSAVHLLVKRITVDLQTLSQLVRANAPSAADVLPTVVRDAVSILNDTARDLESVLRQAAQRLEAWPILASRHPLYSTDKELLERLDVGAKHPLRIAIEARWNATTAGGRAALRLWTYVNDVRKSFPAETTHRRVWASAPSFFQEAASLPAFNKSSAAMWWNVAKKALLHFYPRPEEHDSLGTIPKGKTHTKTPGKRRAKIMEELKRRFIQMAE